MTTTHIAVALWCLACLTALACLVPFLREWDAEAEATRAAHDADDFHAQLAAMTDADVQAWREWADYEGVTDAAAMPLSQTPVARRIRERIADNECARFRAERYEWGRSA